MNLIASLVPLLSLTLAYADDSYVSVYGGALQTFNEHPAIAMDDEYVKIEIYDSSYTVHADFQFFNHGTATNVLVGFPLGGQELNQLHDFKTWVDGAEVPSSDISRSKENSEEESVYEEAFPRSWKTKTVRFPSHSTTKTSIQYSAPVGMAGPAYTASYIYGTGGTWHGPIGKAVFEILIDENRLADMPCRDRYTLVRREKGRFVFQMQNYEPQSLDEGILIQFGTVGRMIKAAEEGSWAIDDVLVGRNRYCFTLPGDREWQCRLAEEKLPRIKRYGCRGDLNYLTLAQLRILRNRVFAEHGRVFEDAQLQKYFEKMGWYRPDKNGESALSDADRDWVNAIREQEKQLRKI